MHQEFWLERWQKNEIGFHCKDVNPYLKRYWQSLNVAQGSKVFVPLCGKSEDMLWLMAQGYHVMGVELSPLAISAFCNENALPSAIAQEGKFTISQGYQFNLYCGNFFDLTPGQFTKIGAVYDRAALIALPPDLRRAYVRHLNDCLNAGVKILLVIFDYEQQEMQGPPFSIKKQDVEALYGGWCEINLLCSENILDQEPRFRERGLTYLQEHAYVLTVKC